MGENRAKDIAQLVATPNPVPHGPGPGTTTITWSTGDGSPGRVYLSPNGGPEQLFAGGPRGSQEASWISAGATYEFRLYAGETDRRALLSTVVVTQDRRAVREYLDNYKVRKLHIGAGDNLLQGWLNADIEPSQKEVIYLDATKSFPFRSSLFDYVFSEHMIEHVTFLEGLTMLEECHRVLKPGGKIRVATPNLLFLIQLYKQNKRPLEKAYIEYSIDSSDHNIQSAGSYEDTFVINNFFRDWGHKFIYDEKVLRSALEKAGFTDISSRQLHESPDEELRGLEAVYRMPEGFLALETMVLEAIKPKIQVL